MKMKGKKMQELHKVKSVSLLTVLRDFVYSKAALPAAVILFATSRFLMDYAGMISLRPYESEFYILLVSGVIWLAYKDAPPIERKADKTVIALHMAIILLSCISLVVIHQLLTINMDELHNLVAHSGDRLGFYLSAALRIEIGVVLAVSVYGYLSYIKGAKKYFCLVSHGMGSALLIYDVLRVLTSLDLPLENINLFAFMWYAVLPYIVGLIPMLLFITIGKGRYGRCKAAYQETGNRA